MVDADPRLPKESLMKKYDIPLYYLDFPYVEGCTDGRELEKIVHILQSGEEGCYPELLKKAEEKLAAIKPNSRYIRKTTAVLDKNSLANQDLTSLSEDLSSWLKDVNMNSNELDCVRKLRAPKDLPEVRKKVQVNTEIAKSDDAKRIKSTDYSSWDKYDPDTEILKMDLQAEKLKKELEVEQKQSTKKVRTVKFNEFSTQAEAIFEADREREKGNECFKAGEHRQALVHYTSSINYMPSVNNYNNRAITRMKLKKYEEAVLDCFSALKYEPQNIKALVRLAQCHEALNDFEKAINTIEKIIRIDPNNTLAQNMASKLSKQLKLANKPATRMKIVEIDEAKKISTKSRPKIWELGSSSTSKRSILKKQEVILSIPGPSTMPEPYFVTVENKDPEIIKRQEYILNHRPQMIYFTNMQSINDDSECLEIHIQKSDDRKKKTNYTQNQPPETGCQIRTDLSHETQLKLNTTSDIKDANGNLVNESQLKPNSRTSIKNPNNELGDKKEPETDSVIDIKNKNAEGDPNSPNFELMIDFKNKNVESEPNTGLSNNGVLYNDNSHNFMNNCNYKKNNENSKSTKITINELQTQKIICDLKFDKNEENLVGHSDFVVNREKAEDLLITENVPIETRTSNVEITNLNCTTYENIDMEIVKFDKNEENLVGHSDFVVNREKAEDLLITENVPIETRTSNVEITNLNCTTYENIDMEIEQKMCEMLTKKDTFSKSECGHKTMDENASIHSDFDYGVNYDYINMNVDKLTKLKINENVQHNLDLQFNVNYKNTNSRDSNHLMTSTKNENVILNQSVATNIKTLTETDRILKLTMDEITQINKELSTAQVNTSLNLDDKVLKSEHHSNIHDKFGNTQTKSELTVNKNLLNNKLDTSVNYDNVNMNLESDKLINAGTIQHISDLDSDLDFNTINMKDVNVCSKKIEKLTMDEVILINNEFNSSDCGENTTVRGESVTTKYSNVQSKIALNCNGVENENRSKKYYETYNNSENYGINKCEFIEETTNPNVDNKHGNKVLASKREHLGNNFCAQTKFENCDSKQTCIENADNVNYKQENTASKVNTIQFKIENETTKLLNHKSKNQNDDNNPIKMDSIQLKVESVGTTNLKYKPNKKNRDNAPTNVGSNQLEIENVNTTDLNVNLATNRINQNRNIITAESRKSNESKNCDYLEINENLADCTTQCEIKCDKNNVRERHVLKLIKNTKGNSLAQSGKKLQTVAAGFDCDIKISDEVSKSNQTLKADTAIRGYTANDCNLNYGDTNGVYVDQQLPQAVTHRHDDEDNNSNNDIIRRTDNMQVNNNGGGGEPHINHIDNLNVRVEELHMPYSFLKMWRSVGRDESYLKQAEVLRNLDYNRLPEVIGYKLDGTMLSDFVTTMYLHFTVAHETDRVCHILENLVRVPRFNIVVMFLTGSDKSRVKCVFEFLEQHGRPLSPNLKRLYI